MQIKAFDNNESEKDANRNLVVIMKVYDQRKNRQKILLR